LENRRKRGKHNPKKQRQKKKKKTENDLNSDSHKHVQRPSIAMCKVVASYHNMHTDSICS
jgi:sorbitol-specific phosphotransferase system component IIBC